MIRPSVVDDIGWDVVEGPATWHGKEGVGPDLRPYLSGGRYLCKSGVDGRSAHWWDIDEHGTGKCRQCGEVWRFRMFFDHDAPKPKHIMRGKGGQFE